MKKGTKYGSPKPRNKGGAGMTNANYNKPYATRVTGLGGMQNNGCARTISGGNKRRGK